MEIARGRSVLKLSSFITTSETLVLLTRQHPSLCPWGELLHFILFITLCLIGISRLDCLIPLTPGGQVSLLFLCVHERAYM